MGSFILLFLAAAVFSLHCCWAVGTDDQVYSNIDYGTFQTPSKNVRPRFRYWPNDASLNLSRVAYDVKQTGKVGAGGVELLGYYLYGDGGAFGGFLSSPLQTDWTTYGFGSVAWKDLLDSVLTAAYKENLLVDLSLGPNQGAGVPAPYDSDGLLWDLAPFNMSVPVGGKFDAILPGWGSGSLISASTALQVSATNTTTGRVVVLDDESLTDVTASVNSSGHLKVQFPYTSKGSNYLVFAYYLRRSGYREVVSPADVQVAVPQSPITNYIQNGSWVVDHFSAKGAQVTIDFWEKQLLHGDTRNLVRAVGNYMWEDSQEFGQGVRIFWTPRLQEVFLSDRGYNINKYIPIVISTNPLFGGFPGLTSTTTYMTNGVDAGTRYITDYQQTLTELNRVYLKTLTDWSESLGIQFSAQVGYNLPMDMQANIPYVNAPECETLGLAHSIDNYRQFSGPANLAGKRIISSEAGAVMGEVYQQTIPEILWDISRSIVGSVNQFIIHGYPYSGNYGNTTWPGFTTFPYVFSEMHGPHQPAWDFYSDWLNWLSRQQFLAQTGVPKRDIAFWSKSTTYLQFLTGYTPNDLLAAGYSYEYLSPDNFALPEAYVKDGVFAPNRQAFKAMILRYNETTTQLGITKLVEYAQDGVPVVFLGGVPIGIANKTRQELLSLENVHVTSPNATLAATLQSIGILPRTSVTTNGSWYTYWREDNRTSTDYVWVYNDATGVPFGQGLTKGNVSFETTGTPYIYDAWTGNETLVSSYQQNATHTTIELQLAGNQSTIIGFRGQQNLTADAHSRRSSTSTSKTSGGSLRSMRDFDKQHRGVEVSSRNSVNINPMTASSFQLANWTLVVESWTAPSDIYDVEAPVTKTNLTFNISTLLPWKELLPSLANVSGLGYYSTSFQWPPIGVDATDLSGAYIDLGAILHTVRVQVNGKRLPPLDLTWAKADIGSALIPGTNIIEVVVSTPLGNALRPIWDEIMTSGKPATASVPVVRPAMDYGLVSPVSIIPYQIDTVAK
ncbi:secreted protein [Rutstroemia sp. NJR-2017a WRK4]|nr:secreted protein [Rutstroemia sp. NJR-2017a WRK4]